MTGHINLVGWLKLWRQIVISDVWKEDEPFDSRSAFLYILTQAYFTPGIYKGLWVERGQFPTSEEELSAVFKWGRGKVHRFLDALSEKETISYEYKTDRRVTLITIRNFDLFQGNDRQVADRQQTCNERVTDRKQTANEQQYKKEEPEQQKKESLSPADAGTPSAEDAPDDPPIGSPEWYRQRYNDDWGDDK